MVLVNERSMMNSESAQDSGTVDVRDNGCSAPGGKASEYGENRWEHPRLGRLGPGPVPYLRNGEQYFIQPR